ncbi:MAG: YqzL family protein [Bacillota bacterium]|nr:YqzL family protein [Bacillota bacterium]
MLKEFAWDAFQYTGNIDAYVFLKEIEENAKIVNQSIITQEEVAISNSADRTM